MEGSTTLKFGITLQNFRSYSLVELASESRENALLEDYLYNSLYSSEVVVEDLTSFLCHPLWNTAVY